MANCNASALIAPGARVVGDVVLRPGSSVWYNAVVRADAEHICIGENTNIQDNAVVHESAGFPVTLGEGVTVGHGAIVHGCTVGDNTLIGMGSVVMDGAVIGCDCIVGAGAVVTPGTVVPDGTVVVGCPAKPVRATTEKDVAANRENAAEYVRLAREQFGRKA